MGIIPVRSHVDKCLLWKLVEKADERGCKMCVGFINIEKAYDWMDRKSLR